MRSYTLAAAAAVTALTSSVAYATPVVLTGNYIKVGISDRGTLGSNGGTSPGLIHDPLGTGTFGVNDYITPGSPHEGYSISSSAGSFSADNNGASSDLGFTSPTLLTGAAALGYANAASWTGGIEGTFNITNSYFFNANDERIRVLTTITALVDLTDLAFARSVDPDPDVNTFGSFATNNQRGNLLFAPENFVGAAGPKTGLTLALVNNTTGYVSNTLIGDSCCSNVDPNTVLANVGGLSSGEDDSLNMAWRIGALKAGASATLDYFYAVGDKIGTVGGDGGAVPEPATWAMMISGFGLIGGSMRYRRRKTGVAFA